MLSVAKHRSSPGRFSPALVGGARVVTPALLAVILLVAACFRFYGQDWDRGYLFHPDERKIVLVAAGLHWPSNISEFFSPDSPLSPQFFAYGSFPIYLLRALNVLAPAAPAEIAVPWGDPNLVPLALLGRTLSGLFDLGTVVLIFLLACQLYDSRAGLIAAACCAVSVQQIQLSHYFTVDTLLTFFVVATLLFAGRLA
ncbi:MAG TPA: glycosyltransferase family 39 protein, partial [Anaerolineae bacterium]